MLDFSFSEFNLLNRFVGDDLVTVAGFGFEARCEEVPNVFAFDDEPVTAVVAVLDGFPNRPVLEDEELDVVIEGLTVFSTTFVFGSELLEVAVDVFVRLPKRLVLEGGLLDIILAVEAPGTVKPEKSGFWDESPLLANETLAAGAVLDVA